MIPFNLADVTRSTEKEKLYTERSYAWDSKGLNFPDYVTKPVEIFNNPSHVDMNSSQSSFKRLTIKSETEDYQDIEVPSPKLNQYDDKKAYADI